MHIKQDLEQPFHWHSIRIKPLLATQNGTEWKLICSVQSKNWDNSRIVLCKLGISTLLHKMNTYGVRDNPEFSVRKVRLWTK